MPLWKRNFGFVWVNNFVTAMGMMAFLPLFPLHLRELGVDDPNALPIWSGILVAGAPLTAAVMGPFWGALGDRVGRKLMMARANLGISVFVGLMILAPNPWVLLALRLGQGMFSGFAAPSLTLVSVSAPRERQGRIAGLLHTSVLAGGVVGPLIGGAIGDRFGYQAVFPVTACLSLLACVISATFVREPQERHEESGPAPRLSQLFTRTWRDVSVLIQPGPLRSLLMSVFLVRLGAALIDPILALFVETLPNVEPRVLATVTGVVAGSAWIATLLMTPWMGRLVDAFGPSRSLKFCAAGAAVLFFAQSLVTQVWQLCVLRFLTGSLLAGIFPAAFGAAARGSTASRRGGAYGVTFSSLVLANGLGPILGGLLAATIGIRPMFWVVAGLLGFAWFRVIQFERRERPAPKGPGHDVKHEEPRKAEPPAVEVK